MGIFWLIDRIREAREIRKDREARRLVEVQCARNTLGFQKSQELLKLTRDKNRARVLSELQEVVVVITRLGPEWVASSTRDSYFEVNTLEFSRPIENKICKGLIGTTHFLDGHISGASIWIEISGAIAYCQSYGINNDEDRDAIFFLISFVKSNKAHRSLVNAREESKQGAKDLFFGPKSKKA
ncbi:MAG: hypothetical protein A3G51_01540 [Candidatus Yanofskybacteria bacterium RIFCSPLOWO2_12_FULL_43_11b]|uniref:Uncharacterized protein n=1 Tax=Candidatus Yanofskybacteria bacterium RIFCSPLOWO2_12_FULL_43_11b TaxID=1802710 RepID=A0A1F8H928_9BACT|nr:MAG: hypothetical protein A3G51_01540 [Candidatus Yanofskybacteria bacterium RIFCSPLOWO2_12_FULL_43_11b]